MNKTEAVLAWVRGWDKLTKLNATRNEADEKAMNTVSNDLVVQEYIDGTADREYTFALVLYQDWSDGNNSYNLEAEKLAESWLEWVSAQYPDNVPDFGENATITKIEPVQNIPTLAAVYQDESLAKYQFQAKIYYTE